MIRQNKVQCYRFYKWTNKTKRRPWSSTDDDKVNAPKLLVRYQTKPLRCWKIPSKLLDVSK